MISLPWLHNPGGLENPPANLRPTPPPRSWEISEIFYVAGGGPGIRRCRVPVESFPPANHTRQSVGVSGRCWPRATFFNRNKFTYFTGRCESVMDLYLSGLPLFRCVVKKFIWSVVVARANSHVHAVMSCILFLLVCYCYYVITSWYDSFFLFLLVGVFFSFLFVSNRKYSESTIERKNRKKTQNKNKNRSSIPGTS